MEGVRIRAAPERTRIVFDLSRPAPHKVFTLAAPHRLVVDLEGAQLKVPLASFALKGTPIRRVRSSLRPGGVRRVVFDLTEAVRQRNFPLQPIASYGDRLVIDICTQGQTLCAGGKGRPAVKQAGELARKERDLVIAIDPGHGGDDPGAVSADGRLKEKHIVLQVGKRLNVLFKAEPGFAPRLIREGDYYLSLRERTDKARELQADAYLSIHADYFKNPKTSGASVYALSESGATSEAAAWLAEKENRADLLGGGGSALALAGMEEGLASVILDLTMTNGLAASLDLGQAVLSALGKVGPVRKKKVERAAFVVLKAEWPSILIETGYISNPAEARQLATGAHQQKLAQAIFEGVRAYFYQFPPDGTYVASHREPVTHTIVSGDTLSELALRYRISQRRIKEANGLSSDTIRIGQKLKIPPI